MGDSEVLREFLVRLGFDAPGSKLFDDKVNAATKNILKLGAVAATMAAAVTYAVTKVSEKLDELYYSSQRIGASVGNIQAFAYAVSQMGGSTSGAVQSLENMARFIRTSPGAIDLIKSLGVRTTDENGQLRDTVDMMTDLGGVLRKMPYYQANAYANVLGIDEKTLMALRDGTEEFADEYRDLMKRAGLDSQRAAKDANSFMKEIRGMDTAVGVLMQKFTSLLSGAMASRMRATREYFVSNFDRIAGAIEVVVNTVGLILGAVSSIFGRAVEIVQALIAWFQAVNPETAAMLKTIGLIAAAWLAVNAVIGLSPLGIVLALGAALLALYDDYKTWKEGGKSLIDWGKWDNEIQLAIEAFKLWGDAFKTLTTWIDTLDQKLGGLLTTFSKIIPGVAGIKTLMGFFSSKEKTQPTAVEQPGGSARVAAGAPAGSTASGTPAAPTDTRTAPILPGPAGTPMQSPTASGAPRVSPKDVKVNTSKAMDFFVSAGWTKDQAAGIVANLRQESGLNAGAVGDKGSAFGIAQWHPDRQANFKKLFGHDIKESTLDEQLKFVQYELTQGAEKHAGDALRATQSADLAAQVVSTQYERPADKEGEAQKRGEAAVTIAQTTNINVTGAGPGTAEEIAGLQKDVNQQIVRNTKGAVR